MYIDNNSIFFKSVPKYWNKEVSGIKPNTIREIPPEEIMAFGINLDENGTLYSRNKVIAFIVLKNTVTHESFARRLTDVSIHNGTWIFSWNSAEGNETEHRKPRGKNMNLKLWLCKLS